MRKPDGNDFTLLDLLMNVFQGCQGKWAWDRKGVAVHPVQELTIEWPYIHRLHNKTSKEPYIIKLDTFKSCWFSWSSTIHRFFFSRLPGHGGHGDQIVSTLTLESEEIQVESVMVEGPAVGKAGNFLDWIAGGLEMNLVFIFFAVTLYIYRWCFFSQYRKWGTSWKQSTVAAKCTTRK